MPASTSRPISTGSRTPTGTTDPGHQSQRSLRLRAGFSALSRRSRRWQHRAYRFGERPIWRPAHRPLRRLESGAISLAQVIARFGAAARRALQCCRSRPHRIRHGGGAPWPRPRVQKAADRSCSSASAAAGGGRCGRVPGQRCLVLHHRADPQRQWRALFLMGRPPHRLRRRRSGRCRAARQGARLLCRRSDRDPEAPGFRFADSCLIADVYGPDETAAAAERYHRKIRPIDGVICVAADAPLTVAAVLKRIGLPGFRCKAPGWPATSSR